MDNPEDLDPDAVETLLQAAEDAANGRIEPVYVEGFEFSPLVGVDTSEAMVGVEMTLDGELVNVAFPMPAAYAFVNGMVATLAEITMDCGEPDCDLHRTVRGDD